MDGEVEVEIAHMGRWFWMDEDSVDLLQLFIFSLRLHFLLEQF